MSKQPNANPPVSPIKVTRRDWRAIPAHVKYLAGGVTRILTGGQRVEVEILG